jgi:RNA polymerase sigma-70 factor (ECF subfamily)
MAERNDTVAHNVPQQGDASPVGREDPQVGQHRSYLLRYASLQLRDRGAAEDAVQETLLAALQSSAPFQGRSSIRTWLTGILKRKIIDHVRRQSRERPLANGRDGDEGDDADAVDSLFAEDGHWRAFPEDWGDPRAAFENKQFWQVFEACSRTMPGKTARVFMMREVLELSTAEICKELSISETNCWVMLHRARQGLRKCLETKWFGRS